MTETILKGFNDFRINKKNRPEGTIETDKGVVHYSCNSPDKEILKKYGILPIGNTYNEKRGEKILSDNELLLIPVELFEKAGRAINTIEAEAILRDIGNK